MKNIELIDGDPAMVSGGPINVYDAPAKQGKWWDCTCHAWGSSEITMTDTVPLERAALPTSR